MINVKKKKINFVPVCAIGDPGEKLHIRLPAILSEVGVKRPKQVFNKYSRDCQKYRRSPPNCVGNVVRP